MLWLAFALVCFGCVDNALLGCFDNTVAAVCLFAVV